MLLRCSRLSSDLPSITHTLIPTPLQGVRDHTVYLDGLKSSTLGASYAATLDELKVSFRRMRAFIKTSGDESAPQRDEQRLRFSLP